LSLSLRTKRHTSMVNTTADVKRDARKVHSEGL